MNTIDDPFNSAYETGSEIALIQFFVMKGTSEDHSSRDRLPTVHSNLLRFASSFSLHSDITKALVSDLVALRLSPSLS